MSLALLDWRRRVTRLYAEVRAEPDVVAAQETGSQVQRPGHAGILFPMGATSRLSAADPPR